MSRINIPIDVLTSRLNLSDRLASVRNTSMATRFSNLKPVSEFLDFKRLSKPQNFGEVQSRVNYNLGYFSSNYAIVFMMLSVYSLITNLTLCFVIVLVVGGMYGIGKLQGGDLNLGFTTLTTSQLYTGLLIIAVPLGFYASPISTVLWLIGASFFRGGGLGSRPRSPKYAPLWGRPPGGLRRKERERLAWERGASLADIYHDSRVEELGSSDDSGAQAGVDLNFSKKRFASDPLQFTGIDLGAKPTARRGYVYQDPDSDSSSDSDSEGSEISERQVALRDKEEALVQSALARIRRAQAKGRSEVKLDPEELEALERRKQRIQKEKAKEERKKNRVTVSLAPTQEVANARRRKHREDVAPPPGMLVAGPDGNLVYAPLGQYPPQALNNGSRNSTGGSSRGSPSSRPRSSTNQSRAGSNPPLSYYPPSAAANGRHISDPQTTTLSSSSPRIRERDPLPHEEGWTRINSASSRRSSASSVASSRHSQRNRPNGSPLADPFAYQVEDAEEIENSSTVPGQYLQSPVASASHVSRDVVYSSLRRNFPGGGQGGQTYQAYSASSTLDPGSQQGNILGASISDPSLPSSRMKQRGGGGVVQSQQHKSYRGSSVSEDDEDTSEDELARMYGNGVKVYVDERERPSSSSSTPQRVRPKDLVGERERDRDREREKEGSAGSPGRDRVSRKPVGSSSGRAKKGKRK